MTDDSGRSEETVEDQDIIILNRNQAKDCGPLCVLCTKINKINQTSTPTSSILTLTNLAHRVHTYAFPLHSSGTIEHMPTGIKAGSYHSGLPAQGTVVLLEMRYFSTNSSQYDTKTVFAICGCLQEGIGCSIWCVLFLRF